MKTNNINNYDNMQDMGFTLIIFCNTVIFLIPIATSNFCSIIKQTGNVKFQNWSSAWELHQLVETLLLSLQNQ